MLCNHVAKSALRNVNILGVFTEKPYSKPLERNVVNILITILGHVTSQP